MGSPRTTERWAAVVAWSAGHFDVVTAAELAALGIPPSQVKSWVRTGRLHPLFRQSWAVGRAVPRPQGLWRAAVLPCGAGTFLSHHSAGAADGLAVPEVHRVHVTTTRELRSSRGRVVHRARALDPRDVTTRFGIPTTATPRTLVDLADVITYSELRHAFDRARRVEVPRVEAARARAGKRRGSPKLTHLLERDEPHTRSALERRFLRFCTAYGIRRPDRVNERRFGYELDCVYEAERTAVELDGRAFHTRGDAVRADHRRDAALHVHGWISHRIVWEQLNPFEADGTASLLRAVLDARRPR